LGLFILLKEQKIRMNEKQIYPLVDLDKFHDASGTGFIVTISGKPESRVLPLALKALHRLADPGSKICRQGNRGWGRDPYRYSKALFQGCAQK
jgi:glutamate synthase domain-containing protein 1